MSCPDCFRGGVATGTPRGTTKPLHGYSTYIASPPSQEGTSTTTKNNSTILLFTDAFGHLLPNNFLLADALSAKTNLTVLVPDIIPGGGMSPAVIPLMDTFSSPGAGALSKAWAFGRAMVHVIPFFMRASPQSEKSTVPCVEYARAVKKQLPAGAKLGIAGYCWGGYQALHIARQGAESLPDAIFVAHPAKYEAAQAEEAVANGVKVCFAHAGEDMSLPMVKIEETKKALEGKEGFEMRVYEGCAHGFAVRANPAKEREGEAAGEALGQAGGWFGKWL
jgi:dienelactone hydrolase